MEGKKSGHGKMIYNNLKIIPENQNEETGEYDFNS
jgi:hypothetical protein